MDVGPTRSAWLPRGRPEPTRPAAPDASRLTADGAALAAKNDEAANTRSGVDAVERPDELQPRRVIDRARGSVLPEATRSEDNVPNDVEPLMERLAAPIRALVESDRLNEEAKRALVHAFTQLESDAYLSATEPKAEMEPGDARQRHQRLEAAIDEFHESLKRIFRIGDDVASEASSGPTSDEVASASAPDQRTAGVLPFASADASSEETLSVRERLLLRIKDTYERPVPKEQDLEQRPEFSPSPDEAKGSDEKAYARFASMYTALYPTALDRTSSLNEEG